MNFRLQKSKFSHKSFSSVKNFYPNAHLEVQIKGMFDTKRRE